MGATIINLLFAFTCIIGTVIGKFEFLVMFKYTCTVANLSIYS